MLRDHLRDALGGLWRAIGYLLGGLGGSLRENGSMALLALALSTALWAFITAEQNPPRTGIFPLRIPVRAVNPPADVEVLGPLESVLVRITAPNDLWADLSDSSFRAMVDVAGQRQGEATLPVQVESTDSRVRILDVVPSEMRVQFDAAKSQQVPVKVNILRAPPVGFSYQEPRIDVANVTIHGPERLVSLVDTAVADVDLSAARTTIRQSFTLVARTSRGNDITGVRIEPANVQVEIPIVRHIDYTSLVVTPDVKGTPAAGYWVSKVRVDPNVVAVVGPQDMLATLNTLKTLPVDVTNLNATVTRTVGLDLPSGLSVVDRNSVQVEVTVQPVQGTAVVQVAPRLTGTPPGFTAVTSPASLEVVVRGEGPALQSVSATTVVATVPLEGRSIGSFPIEPQITVPQGLTVVSVTPPRVQVTLSTGTQR